MMKKKRKYYGYIKNMHFYRKVCFYGGLQNRTQVILRELSKLEQLAIANIDIRQKPTTNAWVAIEDEITMAENSDFEKDLIIDIYNDFPDNALEGYSEERKVKIKTRAVWLANRFALRRKKLKTLFCDYCGFDPKTVIKCDQRYYRSLLDVHHKKPIAEGIRRTNESDFELLCPNCHRLEHLKLRIKGK